MKSADIQLNFMSINGRRSGGFGNTNGGDITGGAAIVGIGDVVITVS